MVKRNPYRTKQKHLVLACMAAHDDVYLTVDEVRDLLRDEGTEVGRATIWRILESASFEGAMAKVAGAERGAARYRSRKASAVGQGQLSCLRCGRALPLDCSMLESFASHVEAHHEFVIDRSRTVLYGMCGACRAEEPTYKDS